MAFFNFNLDNEEVIEAQNEVLNEKFEKWSKINSIEGERKVRAYYMEAVSSFAGEIEDHPAKDVLEQYVKYLADKNYRYMKRDNMIYMKSNRNTIISIPLKQVNQNWPECLSITKMIIMKARKADREK